MRDLDPETRTEAPGIGPDVVRRLGLAKMPIISPLVSLVCPTPWPEGLGPVEEERVYRRLNDGDAICAKQPVIRPVSRSLVGDAVREVGHVRRVVAAEDPVEVGADGEKSNVVTDVR